MTTKAPFRFHLELILVQNVMASKNVGCNKCLRSACPLLQQSKNSTLVTTHVDLNDVLVCMRSEFIEIGHMSALHDFLNSGARIPVRFQESLMRTTQLILVRIQWLFMWLAPGLQRKCKSCYVFRAALPPVFAPSTHFQSEDHLQ